MLYQNLIKSIIANASGLSITSYFQFDTLKQFETNHCMITHLSKHTHIPYVRMKGFIHTLRNPFGAKFFSLKVSLDPKKVVMLKVSLDPKVLQLTRRLKATKNSHTW